MGSRREVILCAGAFNTPKLLMLSGIGDADQLRGHGIDVVAHVPAVGSNLENHPGVDVQFATRHAGLRVVDASIMPKNVTGNLNGPILMLAEKVADRIRGRQPLTLSDADYYRATD